MNTTQSKIGTKGNLRSWLTSMKNLTYTAYCELTPERKLSIQAEYKKKLNSCRSTVIVDERQSSQN